MVNSIQYFEEKCIKNFEKLEDDFIKDPKKLAEYVQGLTNELHALGLRMIQESLEHMNQMLRDSLVRKSRWEVEKDSQKQLLTSLGSVQFTKTLFRNKETGQSAYLLDQIMGIEPHERMSEDAEAKLYEEAVQTSYRRGGEACSLMGNVSKQTVKNKLHKLEFPEFQKLDREKKVVEYLYIDADEDHVSLQFREKKGDLEVSTNHRKNNCLITKLIYVYEGIEPESPRSSRHKLVNPYYFSRVCSGEENEKLWDEVYEYMDSCYDLEKVKKVYINSDGGGWIKAALKRISGTVHCLDEFHLEKYLVRLTSHMKDSATEARAEIREAIRSNQKKTFEDIVERLKSALTGEAGNKRVEEGAEYILSSWEAARVRLMREEGVSSCSAEGHVSHVLSSRMSSRPMGWSVTGAAKMARLRAYQLNGGNMLELARYQKKELAKAAGAEEIEKEILSSTQILESEKNRHGMVGKYMECIHHSMSTDIKKKAYFNKHIWGL